MNPSELGEKLSAGELRSAYLLLGEEALLREDSLAAIRAAAIGDGPVDFNLDRLEGDATSPGALLDAVRTLPVLGVRRLVVLRDPEGARGTSKALGEALVEAVSESRAEGGSVLVVVAAKADARTRWVKAFGDGVVRCEAPRKGRELLSFIAGEARSQGIELEKGAAELLAERIGPQLMALRQELAKASLLAGDGAKVSRAHVMSGSSHLAEEPIWDLTDAIGEGRVADALEQLARLHRAGAASPMLLGVLVTHFRKLMRLGHGGQVPGPPFVQRKLTSQARRYSAPRLMACIRAIHETDTALKGAGALPPEIALERLVIGLSG